MSQEVDQLFIDIFESDVHHAYQRQGAKFETMVRVGGMGEGKRVWFPTIQKKKTTTKARHAELQIADRGESGVWCNLTDTYTEPDFVDDLDEMKTNVAVRQEYSMDHAWALGRQTDQQIITALEASTNATTATGVLTLAKVNEVYVAFGNNAVPWDGMRYMAVSAKGWTDLMAISQFSDADFVPPNEMPFRSAAGTAKNWMGFKIFTQEGGVDADGNADDGALSLSTNTRTCLAWHKRAIGFHRQEGPKTTTGWENLRQGWSIVSRQCCGAVMIDSAAVYEILIDESATP
jgi:hypothetical protein